VRIDSTQLRSALEELHAALAEANLQPEAKIRAQTAASRALEGVGEKSVDADGVSANLQKVGETLKQANVALEEGTSLWASVMNLAKLLGPVVGGAGVVAAWFGLPLP
jgi:multidrug resistance efflux pump